MMGNYDIKNTLLEDVFEPRKLPYLPIVVIDYKVAAHFINTFAESAFEIAQENEEHFRKLVRAMWAYRLNRGPDMLQQFDFVALIADDKKGKLTDSEAAWDGYGYWRHIEAFNLNMQEYKFGRGEKPTLFNIVQEEGYEYIFSPNSSFHYFCKEFYEADDIAGKIARLRRNADPFSPLGRRQVLLSTVDGDWQGLVSDEDEIVWCNTGPWLPRMRSEREVCDYYLRKEGLKISTARECYTVKVEVGDLGDGLLPGSPLRFFDLYEEDEVWNFSEKDTSSLLAILNSNTKSNRQDHLKSAELYLKQNGLFLPEIQPASELEKTGFFEKANKIRREKANPEIKGRNKKYCLEIQSESEFQKCKELIVQDEKTKDEIKAREEDLNIAGCAEDEKTIKKEIKKLKAIRKEIKEILEESFNK
jgi:hypothetical protein